MGLSVHDPLGVPKTYQRANANDWSDEDRLETEPIVFPVDRQTGANRAALDWALARGIKCGGWKTVQFRRDTSHRNSVSQLRGPDDG